MNPPALSTSSNAPGAYWPQKESVPKSSAIPFPDLVADFWPAAATNVFHVQNGVKLRDSTGADVDMSALAPWINPGAWIYVPAADRVYLLGLVWQPDPKFVCATIIDGILPATQADPVFTGVAVRQVSTVKAYTIRVDSAGPTIEGSPVSAGFVSEQPISPRLTSRPTCYDATAGSVSISINQ